MIKSINIDFYKYKNTINLLASPCEGAPAKIWICKYIVLSLARSN